MFNILSIAGVICECTNFFLNRRGLPSAQEGKLTFQRTWNSQLPTYILVNLNLLSTLLLHDHTKPNFPTAMCAVHATPIFKIETCCFLQYTDALLMQPSR